MDRGMKPILLSLALALLMVGCGDGIVDYDDLEERKGVMYLPNEDTPFTGRAESFYENGQKKREWNYKDGKRDGLRTRWYKNGQKKREINYKDGKPDGLWTYWYENGQKIIVENYKDGKAYGLWISYNEDGTEQGRATYKDGELVED